MFTLPDPLHPVIVHFPIVLILLGAGVAVVGVVFHRWHLPWLAAGLLTLGCIGALVASETGETAEHRARALAPAAKLLLETHEEAAERTEAASAVASLLGIAAAILCVLVRRKSIAKGTGESPSHLPKLAFALRTATAIAALTACYFIYQTGHAGGKLVYEHGVGVKSPAMKPASTAKLTQANRD